MDGRSSFERLLLPDGVARSQENSEAQECQSVPDECGK
jgi:hypothetical protein